MVIGPVLRPGGPHEPLGYQITQSLSQDEGGQSPTRRWPSKPGLKISHTPPQLLDHGTQLH